MTAEWIGLVFGVGVIVTGGIVWAVRQEGAIQETRRQIEWHIDSCERIRRDQEAQFHEIMARLDRASAAREEIKETILKILVRLGP